MEVWSSRSSTHTANSLMCRKEGLSFKYLGLLIGVFSITSPSPSTSSSPVAPPLPEQTNTKEDRGSTGRTERREYHLPVIVFGGLGEIGGFKGHGIRASGRESLG
ncbi:hypothetical protein Peur_024946 [Populus x canadensis]